MNNVLCVNCTSIKLLKSQTPDHLLPTRWALIPCSMSNHNNLFDNWQHPCLLLLSLWISSWAPKEIKPLVFHVSLTNLTQWMKGWSIGSLTHAGKYLRMNIFSYQIRPSEDRAIGDGSMVDTRKGVCLLCSGMQVRDRRVNRRGTEIFSKQCFNLRHM